jgi:hypothetical protein
MGVLGARGSCLTKGPLAASQVEKAVNSLHIRLTSKVRVGSYGTRNIL